MSDLTEINFRTFVTKRAEVRKNTGIKGIHQSMQNVAMVLISLNQIASVGDAVDEMLKVLHDSAKKNNDVDALAECEVICQRISEFLI